MRTPKVEDLDICIYHGNCSDGFGAAWAVHKKFGDRVEYLEGVHATKEDDVTYWLDKVRGKRVVCYDFSFSRQLTEKIHSVAASFQVIDHHFSAEKELAGLSYCFFNMFKSGAVLAWESVFPPTTSSKWIFNYKTSPSVPNLLLYVQDRDLWNWALTDSEAVWSYISSLPHDFSVWDELSNLLENKDRRNQVIEVGHAMLMKMGHVSDTIASSMEMWNVAGHSVPVANCPSILRSDVCESLGKRGKHPFVGCYQIEQGAATWSLRSNYGTEDVSGIAGHFPGGGGHKEAAGFTVSVDRMDFKNKRIL